MRRLGKLSLAAAALALFQSPSFGQTFPNSGSPLDLPVLSQPVEKFPPAPPRSFVQENLKKLEQPKVVDPPKPDAVKPAAPKAGDAPKPMPSSGGAPVKVTDSPRMNGGSTIIHPMPSESMPATSPSPTVIHSSPMASMAPAALCAETVGGACPDAECEKRLGFLAFGDYLYLSARNADLVYAQPRDGCTANSTPRGNIAVADPDYSSGFRIGAGVAFGDDWLILGTYTWFESNTNSSIVAAPGTFIHSLVTLPSLPNCGDSSLAARARYDIDFRLADLDLKNQFCGGCKWGVNYLVGVRYAHLDQDFLGNFSILGNTDVTTRINFDGIGPRIGLEGEHRLCGGVYTYGRGIASLLAGHFSASYLQTNQFAGVQADTNYKDDRIVPILELELGLGWQNESGRLRLQAGYYVAGWFNALTTPVLIDGLRGNSFSHNGDNLRDTLTFDGLTARVEVRF